MSVAFALSKCLFISALLAGFFLLPQAQSFSSHSSEMVIGRSIKFDHRLLALTKDETVGRDNTNVRIKTLSDWSEEAGNNALRSVQRLASKVAESTAAGDGDGLGNVQHVAGTGGEVFSKESKRARDKSSILRPALEVTPRSKRQEQVWSALANLELDMQLLDNMAGQQPQLTALELTLLSLSVAAAASGPFIFGGALTEFVAPTSAACTFGETRWVCSLTPIHSPHSFIFRLGSLCCNWYRCGICWSSLRRRWEGSGGSDDCLCS